MLQETVIPYLNELIQQAFDIWEEIKMDPEQDLVLNLSHSVGRRLEACIKAKGKPTKYRCNKIDF